MILGSYLYLVVCNPAPPGPVKRIAREHVSCHFGVPPWTAQPTLLFAERALTGRECRVMAGEELILATVLAIILVLVILRAAVKVVREYERLVIFRLGRLLSKPKGPGLTWIIPIFDRRVLIDLRTVAFDHGGR